MKIALTLVVICVWIYKVDSKSMNKSTNAGDESSPNGTASPITMSQTVLSKSPDPSPIPTTNQSADAHGELVVDNKPKDDWFGKNSSIPVIALASIVLVLVLVVIVLSVIIVVNRKRMFRIKSQLAKSKSPLGSPQGSFSQECTEDINHNPSASPRSQQSQRSPQSAQCSRVSLGSRFFVTEEDNQRNASLKYDQPYAHQKPIADMMIAIANNRPATQVIQDPPSQASIESGTYLTPNEAVREILPNCSTKNAVSNDNLSTYSSDNGSEYQVPRSGANKPTELPEDPPVRSQSTLKDDFEYVVMMGGIQHLKADDEKAEKWRKDHKNPTHIRDTMKMFVPENFQSKMKFFQNKTNSEKDLSSDSNNTITNEQPQYDIPKIPLP